MTGIDEEKQAVMAGVAMLVKDGIEAQPVLSGWSFALIFIPPDGGEGMLMSDAPPAEAINALHKMHEGLSQCAPEIEAVQCRIN